MEFKGLKFKITAFNASGINNGICGLGCLSNQKEVFSFDSQTSNCELIDFNFESVKQELLNENYNSIFFDYHRNECDLGEIVFQLSDSTFPLDTKSYQKFNPMCSIKSIKVLTFQLK